MRNGILGCLLVIATLLLMNQQTTLVEAKPFLLPANFFVLTTKAPINGQSNCNCNTGSTSTSTTFQIPDLITPKIRLLSTIIQNLSRFKSVKSSSSNGGVTGNFGFTFNKFGGFGPAVAATTTTTSKPDKTTTPDAVFEPDSTEASSSSTTTTSSISVLSSSTTTEYNYEADKGTQNAGNDNGKPGSNGSGDLAISIDKGNTNGEDKGTQSTGQPGSNGGSTISIGGGYNYEGDQGTQSTGQPGSNGGSGISIDGGYNYEGDQGTQSTTQPGNNGGSGISIDGRYNFAGNGNPITGGSISSTANVGYQYNRATENELLK